MKIANKNLKIRNIPGLLGVKGRTSDNKLIKGEIGWAPNYDLSKGLEKTYPWILNQANKAKEVKK